MAVLNQHLAPLPFSPGWQISWNSPPCRKLTKTKLEGSWKWRCVASPAISCGAPVSLLIRPWDETQKNYPTKTKKTFLVYISYIFPPAILRIYSPTNEFLFSFLFVNIKAPWSWLIKSSTTHQSGKKFDAEEKMFLDLTIHLGMLFADEWVG